MLLCQSNLRSTLQGEIFLAVTVICMHALANMSSTFCIDERSPTLFFFSTSMLEMARRSFASFLLELYLICTRLLSTTNLHLHGHRHSLYWAGCRLGALSVVMAIAGVARSNYSSSMLGLATPQCCNCPTH